MNNRVYLVLGVKDYYSDIVKVFDSEHKAYTYIKRMEHNPRSKYDFYEIEVFDVS